MIFCESKQKLAVLAGLGRCSASATFRAQAGETVQANRIFIINI
jgi:hypothetical protein